ncbi:hypothetical protein [Haladaptatus sp. DYF46]|uniref:DUF7475 family protein n=1 Tax=Haladaptatus sp. DYF46 TaxID=2886041 RepID=UPI001E496134|nr:hypothetical protein [Haladaptatus sp. DYF46]
MATETRSWFDDTDGLTSLDYVGILLAAITGLIHLYEGVEDLGEGIFGILFILAGLGFFGAIVLLWMGFNRRVLYPVGIAYTGIQFAAYFGLRWPNVYEPLGLVDKLVQLLLIVVLFLLWQTVE